MTEPDDDRRGPSGLQRALFALFAVLLVVGVGARWWLGDGDATAPGGPTVHDHDAPAVGLVEGAPPAGDAAEAVPAPVERALPFVTEASLAGLLGIALGYASRWALKGALIALAALFLVVQGLAYAGVLTVDWGRAAELLDALVLNLKGGATTLDWVTHRLPSAGTFLAAFAVGFRRS